MADLTFKANLLPNSDLGKALGSSNQRWNIYGELNGNASSADKWKNTRTLTIGNKSQNIDGSNDISYSLHDINYTNIAIGTATSWNYTTPGVYGVASSAAFTGEGHPESTNGGLTPYRYGQLLVYRANNYGISQFYISHHDSSSSNYGIKYRTGWNSNYESTWSTLLDNTNYTQYTVTKTGSGASGTWGINISGSATTLKDRTNNTLTYSNYGAAGLAASAVSWLTCWNGYELRAISKAEMANAVDSSHKWVRLNGDTMSGTLYSTGFWANQGSGERQLGVTYSNGNLYFWANPSSGTAGIYDSNGGYVIQRDTSTNKYNIYGQRVYGAVWNDYAEYRKDNLKEEQEPGRCVREVGDGTLALTTKRLERGCEIISDTFGFAIGQDKENGYNTPIASNGRVLAYPYESIGEFSKHIGWPVCSGPDGTVSIMTEDEEEKYPSRIIGTISEIPTYKEWGTGKVKVNGRIWIRIR